MVRELPCYVDAGRTSGVVRKLDHRQANYSAKWRFGTMTTTLELWDKLRQQPHSWIPSERVWCFVLTANERETVLKSLITPRAEERQTGWQPIETVPRDGTVVLLHCSMDNLCGYASSVRSKKKIAVGYFDGHWVDGRPGGHGSGGGDSNYTHWMPLPAAPEGEG